MPKVCEPFPFTMKSSADELLEPLPDNNKYGQQDGVLEGFQLAMTLSDRLSRFAPKSTGQQKDILLKELYSGKAETIRHAATKGLITFGTEEARSVQPVFLMDPSLVATHNSLHRSLHQSNGPPRFKSASWLCTKLANSLSRAVAGWVMGCEETAGTELTAIAHSEPLSRLDRYTQTHQIYSLAKAIHEHRGDRDQSMAEYESFLGSNPVHNDHACQPSMGMFNKASTDFHGHPEYVIPRFQFQYEPPTVSEHPTDATHLKSWLTRYDEELELVNDELRDYLSNMIFVDMNEATLKVLKVPTTLPEFLAWREAGISDSLDVCT